ncbi:4-oxalomesaconate tautomerase [Thiothrix subterranea]|uniref:4-oxalomesaconate tautomerase n=1 Tax=Thiothrix subterranea TaxID=2735563 RepID=A0AA51R441_9GAMM|nr:4-oxalomesaconate tautomerase [Thiothrix subterranea]MDQ5769288.1 4-oxalomesaconate tautomerase [Thiothrix subterranea]WML86271.1 4-oxalomesaconate tautomerase [Thiothrix subterranea]
MQTAIPYMQIRGGSSKGVYFRADDLPADPEARNQVLLRAMGRDARQIDGLGGAHPLTSKVGIVSLSDRADSDVDYLFVQVVVGENRVDTTPNCGNILAGVGSFALESGMVIPSGETTTVRVHMLNSGSLCELVIQTPGGKVVYTGDTRIDGVPGTAAPIVCHYLDVAGSACGALLPTGNAKDVIDGISVTCIDNGMPVVVLRAADFGKTGRETCQELDEDLVFRQKLEAIRLQAGYRMNLGDVTKKVVPKMSLIASPLAGGHVSTRTFIPHTCHSSIGVLGAVSVATACILPGSVAEGIVVIPAGTPKNITVEHPSGEFAVELALNEQGTVIKAGLLRTARLLSRGELYI